MHMFLKFSTSSGGPRARVVVWPIFLIYQFTLARASLNEFRKHQPGLGRGVEAIDSLLLPVPPKRSEQRGCPLLAESYYYIPAERERARDRIDGLCREATDCDAGPTSGSVSQSCDANQRGRDQMNAAAAAVVVGGGIHVLSCRWTESARGRLRRTDMSPASTQGTLDARPTWGLVWNTAPAIHPAITSETD
ncbi:hypothetical protein DFH07DRAFT_765745 [Mycena maculata]|uniref:Uncharacterized protein n=1 Tax=Mycena maculata TaxID=230809 RepID=A0AAD7K942_9AGAR|nr:hypothetical protein DFH07DRAFT_765745 [Mycena maculata]